MLTLDEEDHLGVRGPLAAWYIARKRWDDLRELLEQFAAEAGDANGVLGAEAAGGVRQDREPIEIEILKQRSSLRIHESFASNRDRHRAASALGQRPPHGGGVGVLAGAGDQSASQRGAAHGKGGDLGDREGRRVGGGHAKRLRRWQGAGGGSAAAH